jgi:hypothetical protein
VWTAAPVSAPTAAAHAQHEAPRTRRPGADPTGLCVPSQPPSSPSM